MWNGGSPGICLPRAVPLRPLTGFLGSEMLKQRAGLGWGLRTCPVRLQRPSARSSLARPIPALGMALSAAGWHQFSSFSSRGTGRSCGRTQVPSTRVWKCPDLLPHLLFAAAPGIPASYQRFLPEILSVDLDWSLLSPAQPLWPAWSSPWHCLIPPGQTW